MRAAWVLVLCSCASLPPEEEAEALFQQAGRHPDRALELLTRAIELKPRAAYFGARAALHLKAGRTIEGLRDAERAAALGGWPERLEQAVLRLKSGDAQGAKEDLDAVLAEAPGHVEARLHRARACRMLGRADEAERDLIEARRTGAGFATDFYNAGARALSLGDPDEADLQFGFALDLVPGHAEANLGRAWILMERKRFTEAALHLDRAVEARPNDAALRFHRGNARMAAGRGFEALEDFERAVELDGSSAAYLAARGMARRLARSDLDAAKRDYDAAILLDERCYAAWYNRGLLAQERGDLDAAERDLRAAVAIRAQPEGNLALVRVLIDRGSTEAARRLIASSLKFYEDAGVRAAFRSEQDRLEKK